MNSVVCPRTMFPDTIVLTDRVLAVPLVRETVRPFPLVILQPVPGRDDVLAVVVLLVSLVVVVAPATEKQGDGRQGEKNPSHHGGKDYYN